MLGVVHAMRTWRCYLEGAVGVTVVTDHNPLTYLKTQPVLSRRQARWSEYLQQFHFSWLYRPGRCNVADPLSRLPVQGACESAVVSALGLNVVTRARSKAAENAVQADPQVQHVGSGAEHGAGSESDKLGADLQPQQDAVQGDLTMQDADTVAAGDQVMKSAVSADSVEPQQSESASLGAESGFKAKVRAAYVGDSSFADGAFTKENLTFKDGLWFAGKRLAVPRVGTLRHECMHEMHDIPLSGHMGVNKTQEAVTRLFWWPTVRKDVKQYVLTCSSCQRNKPSNQKRSGFMVPLQIPHRRWSSVSIDLITGLPETVNGNTCIVVFVDRLSKMVHFAAAPTNTGALECAKLMWHNVVKLHGMPRDLVSDQDARWKGKFWTELCRLTETTQSMSTPYHPQTDGQTERSNRTLEEMLMHFVNPTRNDWDDADLDGAEIACNNMWHESIRSTPSILNYGQQPYTPASMGLDEDSAVPLAHSFMKEIVQAVKEAKQFLEMAQQRQKKYYDLGRKDTVFKVGAQVLLNTKNIR